MPRLYLGAKPPSQIVIFEETNAHIVVDLIPKNLSYTIFHTSPVEINLSIRTFLKFITNLKYFNFKFLFQKTHSLFYGLFWQLKMIYIKSDIDLRHPKAIMTFIDNSPQFAWLSTNFKDVPCIAIQNGFRLAYCAENESRYHCQHLFCFGKQQTESFPKLGYKVNHFYPVGSLNLSHNFDIKLSKAKPVYDFLVISCWRGNIGDSLDVIDSMRAMGKMDEVFSEYLKTKKFRAAVLLRSERDSEDWIMNLTGMSEEDYYKSVYGSSIEIIETNFSQRNVYPTMQLSDVIIAGASTTCIVEAFAMGKKVLYVNFCDSDKYHVDFDAEIVFTGKIGDDNKRLWQRLDYLQKIPTQDYQVKNNELMDYYVRKPTNLSTREEIKSKTSSIIGLKL